MRILSSISNAIVLRFIEKEALGVINVRLILLYSTCHFFSREAFRRSCLSKFNVYNFQKKCNLLWLSIPTCCICVTVLGYVWLHWLEMPSTHLVPNYPLGVSVVLISVLVEMLAEPVYVFSQSYHFVKLKVFIEGLSLTLKSMTMVIFLWLWPGNAIGAFCISQLVGSAAVGIGGWSFLEEYNYKGLPEVNSAFELFVNISIAVMVIGGVVFIISFAGCLGALRENTCLLKFYSVTLLILFIGEMAAAIFAFVFPNHFIDAVKEGLSKEPIAKYRDDVNLQNVIDAFQTEFQCCGVTDEGYKDWSKNMYFNCTVQNQSPEWCAVSYSCCRNPHTIESGLINVMCGYQMQNASLFAIYLCKSLLAQISTQLAQWR